MSHDTVPADSITGVRTLLYIPIIHTQADMGSMAGEFEQAAIRRLGRQGWKRMRDEVERHWNDIERIMDGLSTPLDKVRLYQDGLAVCGREREIVAEAARAGSRNHGLLLRMMARGAALTGTESGELLQEEYRRARQELDQGQAGPRARAASASERATRDRILLEDRDRFIAERINTTLRPGETGILFLGMLHSPQAMLDRDIRVVYPVHRPQR